MSVKCNDLRPTLPLAPYIGGKRLLSKVIIKLIQQVSHHTYVEPFMGMGGVFLRRSKAAPVEIINDLSKDVSGLFRICQRHLPQFVDVLKYQITSRAEFERLIAVNPDTLTDLERAARFLYLQRISFGGKVAGRTFGTGPSNSGRFNLGKIVPMLEDVHERIQGVTIECLTYEKVLQKYDRPETLFYLDPPYYGVEEYYGPGFKREYFPIMSDQLSALRGTFIMSLNDTPEVRSIFSGFNLWRVPVTYSVAGFDRHRKTHELIITNQVFDNAIDGLSKVA